MPGGLGKGLGSLLSSAQQVPPVDSERIINLSPELIEANRQQPRSYFNQDSLQELADSIKEFGVLQPLIVVKTAVGYELIAGERRLRASKMAGLKTVPVIVRTADEQAQLALALLENIQRENLNPLEEARAYKRLMDEFKITQEDLARRLGKGRSTIANFLRMLNLPESAQQALAEGRINLGQAKILAGVEAENQVQALEKMTTDKTTVAQADLVAKKINNRPVAVASQANDKGKEFLLREFFQAKVKIVRQVHGGQVVILFNDDEELAELMEKIR